MRKLAIVASLTSILAGCAGGISGLDGSSQFACKAPDGVTCSSLSGVYANAVDGNLPALRKADKSSGPDFNANAAKVITRQEGAIVGNAPSNGDPIRTPSKMLRIWVAPWEDSEGDLHDQSYIYVMADPGRWVIEHSQRRIEQRYRPTFIQARLPQKSTPASRQDQGGGVVLPGGQSYSRPNAAPLTDSKGVDE